jgi:hypothetical protein
MEVSDQLDALIALPPGEEKPVPFNSVWVGPRARLFFNGGGGAWWRREEKNVVSCWEEKRYLLY